MTEIYPVILAGGSGTRLWPLSRKSYPKQFSKLIDETSLFQQTLTRFKSSEIMKFEPPIVLTNADFRFIVTEQIKSCGLELGPVLIEPSSKSTAPAILSASLFAIDLNEDAILVVAPSDHIISNNLAFQSMLNKGVQQAQIGNIVTFGVKPSRPETGYGYLELGKEVGSFVHKVKRFVEKPESKLADIMSSDDNYLWNAGIFMFRAKDLIKAFEYYSPEILQQVREAVLKGKPDLNFFRLDEQPWSSLDNISLDYAIMEKADNIVAIKFMEKWSDLGSWDSVWKETHQDDNGVSISQNAHAFECKNTLLRSESSSQQIVGLGLKDIIAIAMPDAVLIADKSRSQDVKKVVSELKYKGISQSEVSSRDHRPWGWFESLALEKCFQVKRICVNPGAALSLQSHKYRSEHWIVVEGEAKVTINGEVHFLSESQSVYVPQGAIHRMENQGELPMLLIEVQTGTYLGEDDIVRYEDLYSRQ